MDDLIAFLWARLDEDETAIRTWAACCVHIDACDETGGYLERFDTRRMLAEVEAKREILDEYRLWAEDDSRDYDQSQTAADRTAALEVVVKLLAQPYAEHPDCRPEWRS